MHTCVSPHTPTDSMARIISLTPKLWPGLELKSAQLHIYEVPWFRTLYCMSYQVWQSAPKESSTVRFFQVNRPNYFSHDSIFVHPTPTVRNNSGWWFLTRKKKNQLKCPPPPPRSQPSTVEQKMTSLEANLDIFQPNWTITISGLGFPLWKAVPFYQSKKRPSLKWIIWPEQVSTSPLSSSVT